MNFYKYLKSQFSNLEEAKEFYKKWKYEWDQNIPGHPEWSVDGEDIEDEPNGFSLRAMAGHISDVLTNTSEFEDGNCYMFTKYGSEIYFV